MSRIRIRNPMKTSRAVMEFFIQSAKVRAVEFDIGVVY